MWPADFSNYKTSFRNVQYAHQEKQRQQARMKAARRA
jgi:hypothetical protein